MPRPASERIAMDFATIAGMTTCHLQKEITLVKLISGFKKEIINLIRNLIESRFT